MGPDQLPRPVACYFSFAGRPQCARLKHCAKTCCRRGQMRRREFIRLIGGAAASPLAARAQQPAKMKRIAMVSPSERVADMVPNFHRFYRAFFDELSRLGYPEGKSLVVERY